MDWITSPEVEVDLGADDHVVLLANLPLRTVMPLMRRAAGTFRDPTNRGHD